MRAYSTREVAELLGESPARVRSFARASFISPLKTSGGHYRFSFQDLVMLRAAKGLVEAKLDPRRLWRALRALRRQLPSDRPLGIAFWFENRMPPGKRSPDKRLWTSP